MTQMQNKTSGLDFMIIGLPRSGTTWASNWLTTDVSHCVHDPLYQNHYSEWDTAERFGHGRGVLTGAACTGIWRWADWLNAHPARKVMLHRDAGDVNASLRRLGLPEVEQYAGLMLSSVEGLHVRHTDLFYPGRAEAIWRYLLPGIPFNAARHRELVGIEMQPKFEGLSVGHEVTRRLLDELSDAVGWGG